MPTRPRAALAAAAITPALLSPVSHDPPAAAAGPIHSTHSVPVEPRDPDAGWRRAAVTSRRAEQALAARKAKARRAIALAAARTAMALAKAERAAEQAKAQAAIVAVSHNPPAHSDNRAKAIQAVVTPSGSLAGELTELRGCESGGSYTEDTGNGFYGAYQFDAVTWQSVTGRHDVASDAPPGVQDEAALDLHAERGWAPWPACSAKLGLL